MSKSEQKPDSLVATLLAVGRIGLVLLGIVGIAVHLFSDEGLIEKSLDKLFSSTMTLLALPVILLLLYFANRWLTTPRRGELSKRGDIPLYLMMALGMFFLFRLATTGSF